MEMLDSVMTPLLIQQGRRCGKSRGSRKQLLELVEAEAPAAAVVVARLLVEELLVRERQDRAVGVGLDVDGDLRLTLGRRAPRPAEDQLAVGHDLFVGAAHVVLLAGVALEADMEAAADAQVRLGGAGGLVVATPPAHHLRGLRPGFVDFFRRGFESALEGKAGLAVHWSFSRNAARRSSWSIQ